MVPAPEDDDHYPDEEEAPSKSARKRAAHAAQDLGEELIALRDADLDALDLPERLTDAIREARRITSRAGLARQRQYIGKLMRDLDLEPIRAALAARDEQNALEAQRFKRIESWRDRLIAEGDTALDDLARARPTLKRREFQRLMNTAIAERVRTSAPGPASRELFRALRAVFEGSEE